MTKLRTIAMAALLLAVAGCGCGDEAGGIQPGVVVPVRIRAALAPAQVPPRQSRVDVDVLLLLDDGYEMTGYRDAAGNPVAAGTAQNPLPTFGQLPDGRNKSQVARSVYDAVKNDLQASLQTALPGRNFDLAFGVARYEDYGGAFDRSSPVARPDTRPFILNLPILRQGFAANGQNFEALFQAALAREAALGDGGFGNAGTPLSDAQSAFEGFRQAATGVGFDGNGNGNTTDSGLAGVPTTQTAPGASGDVPAAQFAANGTDDDGEPLYDLNGTPASGNVGGAGWRPCSIRFIIVASDYCTVAPFPANLAGDPLLGEIQNTPSPAGTGPRTAETRPNINFVCDAFMLNESEAQRAVRRFGKVSMPGVAPTNGSSVQEAIAALNLRNIEVLGLGTDPRLMPGRPSPASTGGVGTEATAPPAEPNPVVPINNNWPFTWMSAVSLLTDCVNAQQIPLVYRFTQASPAQGTFTTVIPDDMAYRVGQWLQFLPFEGCAAIGETDCIALNFAINMAQPDLSTGVVLDPLFPPVPTTPVTNVQLPTIPTGQVPQPDQYTYVEWQVVAQRANQAQNQTLIATVPFSVTVTPVGALPPGVVVPTNPSGAFTVTLPQQFIGFYTPATASLAPGAVGCVVVQYDELNEAGLVVATFGDRSPGCPPGNDVTGQGPEKAASTSCGAAPPAAGELVITAINPTSGPLAGGTLVTVTGSGLAAGTLEGFFTIGGDMAVLLQNLTVVNDTTATFVTPPGTGVADLTLSNANGVDTLLGAYTYVDGNPEAEPTIASVAPDSGPIAGGTPVTITGTGFTAGATVRFNLAEATAVVVNGQGTQITCVTPPNPAGPAVVSVTTPNGTGILPTGFTYVGNPTVVLRGH
jgi:hypothetical protein